MARARNCLFRHPTATTFAMGTHIEFEERITRRSVMIVHLSEQREPLCLDELPLVERVAHDEVRSMLAPLGDERYCQRVGPYGRSVTSE
jgi:hypothetical protein